MRRGDALRVGRPHVRDGVLRFATEKTSERVSVGVSPALAEALAAGPCGELTYIATMDGRPMSKESFGNWFDEIAKAAAREVRPWAAKGGGDGGRDSRMERRRA